MRLSLRYKMLLALVVGAFAPLATFVALATGPDAGGRATAAGAALVTALIFAGCAWWWSRAVLGPLERLHAAMAALGRGESLPPPAPLANDELGEMTRAFAEMQGALARQHASLEERALTLADEREHLAMLRRVLQEERGRHDAIVEHGSDGIVLFNRDLTITLFNRGAAELTGVAGAAGSGGVGRPCRDVLRCRNVAGQLLCDVACPARRGFAGERLTDLELRLAGPDGGERWVSASFTPISPGATVEGADRAARPGRREVVAVLRDITERRAVQAMQTEFVASVSHELRAPLATIRAYTEILLDDVPPGSLNASFLATIEHETDYLTDLIDNLLNVARIESGRLRPEPTEIHLAGLLAAAATSFAPQLEGRDLAWVATIGRNLPPIRGDKDLLAILVTNLVSNAVKYNRQGGCVLVEARATPGGGVALTVGDEGPGIPPRERERIFEKFYRVASTTESGIKGSGLGLYLVRQIAALHGGTVTVESTAGAGSRFTVTLYGAMEEGLRTEDSGLSGLRRSAFPGTQSPVLSPQS